jgi:hypothetical protein
MRNIPGFSKVTKKAGGRKSKKKGGRTTPKKRP